MIHLPKTLLLSLSTMLLIGLPSNAQKATTPIPAEPPWILSPTHVPADSAFDLNLSSFRYNCGTKFKELEASVENGSIVLKFSTYYLPLICTMEYRPYGTTFRVPGLKAGEYPVYAQPLNGGNRRQEFAGTLTVGLEPPIKYGIQPRSVPAKQDFNLKLWANIFTCIDTFSLKSSRIDPNGDITLTFLDSHDPRIAVKCPATFAPWGPTYKLSALPEGKYAVYAERLPACAAQGCKMAPIRQFADSLTVLPTTVRKGWYVDPSHVAAERKFPLRVLNYAYGNCKTSFSHESINTSGGRIVATFVVEDHDERDCIHDMRPHGPTFAVGALKAGHYPVYVNQAPACQFEQPLCAVDYLPFDMRIPDDTLIVAAAQNPRSGWFVSPKEVPAHQDFALKIQDSAYGDCQTRFSHETISVSGGAIHATFVIKTDTTIRCITNNTPHGPTFKMDGLKEGKYPVYVTNPPACLFQNPVCEIMPIPDTLRLPDDTLYVSSTSAVLLGGKVARAPRGTYSLGTINLALPQGSQGIWKAELTTLSGRGLGKATMVSNTDGVGTARYPLPQGTQRGIYLLRLQSPAKETHTLRIPVGD